MDATYDLIGINYSDLRKPDARIADMINEGLGSAKTILNVGAGTGSYEPADRNVTSLEPSDAMIQQRPAGAAKAIQGFAEELPFPDDSFDAAMAILTVHHWTDFAQGAAEMRRVARDRIVILTFDADHQSAWLNDYIPELVTLDDGQMPRMTDYGEALGPVDIVPVPIPHDCTDGFLYAYWRRPAAYLDPRIRTGMSSFWAIDNVDAGLDTLAADLESGRWEERYGHLLDEDAVDLGYRIVITR
ncbi:class I SAM-dependent methyltransferase [Parasphingopyxis sp. CP4]|uniref:class I SAM-dependent methyltransferase n=1 Tax=Parasphingopyxis sp. CP4 TaxID=2724527 RepID=UPI0015A20839|nr:class I SAM-dependent methyltransferase [Parasphingopyxis sp. CP4]QLC21623.1 class I SAM-dependent methyltransferase [Parasphingopyxis sp. CP4]